LTPWSIADDEEWAERFLEGGHDIDESGED